MKEIISFLIENWLAIYLSIGVIVCVFSVVAVWCIIPETIYKSIVESSFDRSSLFLLLIAAVFFAGLVVSWLLIAIFLIYLVIYDAIKSKYYGRNQCARA